MIRTFTAWVAVSSLVLGYVGMSLHWAVVPHTWSPGLGGFVHSHFDQAKKAKDDRTAISAFSLIEEPDICRANAIRPSESVLSESPEEMEVMLTPGGGLLPSLLVPRDRRSHLQIAPKTSPPIY